MTQIELTSMSSKGQVVIPLALRTGIKEGDRLVVMRSGDQIILKRSDAFEKNIQEDIEFARRTEAAWRDVDEGRATTMEFDDFITEMKKW